MGVVNDRAFLDLAARLAWRGFGRVEPNPMVGAVLVREGRIIGRGHHRVYGGPHAEREAITDAQRQAEPTRGATLYTTLEPCTHVGKQPPCVPAIVEAGIRRVVVACADVNPVAAGGAAALRQAGVQVDFCADSPGAIRVSEPFLRRVRTGRPLVIVKWAQTVDGRIATRTGESRWVSGARARARVHRMRARVDVVLTGIGTVLADDPQLTVRCGAPPRRVAARVIMDTALQTPLDSALVRTAGQTPTLIACAQDSVHDAAIRERAEWYRNAGVALLPAARSAPGGRVDPGAVLKHLAAERRAATVLVEAGPRLVGSLLRAGLVDVVVVYVAPIVLGDEHGRPAASGRIAPRFADADRFGLIRVSRVDDDVELVYVARDPAPANPRPRAAERERTGP